MDALLSAVASDLIGRVVSFLISKYQEPSATDDLVRLQRALLRARLIVEEADGRQISNRAMLLQLNQLRQELCRGSYVLDALSRRLVAVGPNRRSHATASRSRPFSLPPPGRERDAAGWLAVAADRAEAALSDMREFVVVLAGCPRVARQPYSAYLFMENCMFGRQMEKEQIIRFLLQPPAHQELDVLPIIGPHEVGKRMLVEHVCLDERVREHFAKIHHLSTDRLDLASHDHETIDTAARSLLVVDLAGGDADEEERWRRFRSSVRVRAHGESKMVLISRTEQHSGVGTVPPLMLWYLFKALAFGGADPEERPELLRIAMAVFATIPDFMPLTAANIYSAALRADLNATSWRRVLKVWAGVTKPPLGVLPLPGGSDRPLKTAYLMPHVPPEKEATSTTSCLFYDDSRKSTGMARSELPTVTTLELVSGGAAVPCGETRFDVLAWQSRIPPYATYISTCDMEVARQLVAGKKRLNKRSRGQ